MIKKEQYCLLFIILGSVSLNFLNAPFSEIFFDDKEIFKYAGLVIFKGGVPYRDMFDHKPPLIYFLNALHWQNAWIPWLVDTLLVLFATLLFYVLCKKNKLAWPWFLPLIFNLLIRYSLVSFGNGMTREYTAVFLLIFFCIMQGDTKYKYYILGILVGLTFWMQQDGLITLAPFLMYSVLHSPTGSSGHKLKKTGILLAGILSMTVPLLLYFIFHQSLSYLWKDAFLFNLQAPGSQPGFFEKLKAIKHAIHETEFEMAFYTAFILGAASVFMKNKKPVLLYMALMALILSVPGELLTGRLRIGNAFNDYLLPLASTIPILVFVVFNETQVSFLRDKTGQFIFSLIISTVLFLGTLRFASGLGSSRDSTRLLNELPEFEYLKTQSLSDYQLFVFDDSNLIYFYNYFRILSPSPWIYQYFYHWSREWDSDNKILESIIQNLQSHKTRFILDCSAVRNDFINKEQYAEWQNFLQSHYLPVIKDSSNRMLWRIQ